jgi:hypothetical protein
MKPIKFKQQNCVYAQNQQEYLPLPAHKDKSNIITSCWKASFVERIIFLITGKVWVQIMSFDKPLQPQKISIKKPLYNIYTEK